MNNNKKDNTAIALVFVVLVVMGCILIGWFAVQSVFAAAVPAPQSETRQPKATKALEIAPEIVLSATPTPTATLDPTAAAIAFIELEKLEKQNEAERIKLQAAMITQAAEGTRAAFYAVELTGTAAAASKTEAAQPTRAIETQMAATATQVSEHLAATITAEAPALKSAQAEADMIPYWYAGKIIAVILAAAGVFYLLKSLADAVRYKSWEDYMSTQQGFDAEDIQPAMAQVNHYEGGQLREAMQVRVPLSAHEIKKIKLALAQPLKLTHANMTPIDIGKPWTMSRGNWDSIRDRVLKPGNDPVIATSDANGEIEFTKDGQNILGLN
jgi:hypothetical protein